MPFPFFFRGKVRVNTVNDHSFKRNVHIHVDDPKTLEKRHGVFHLNYKVIDGQVYESLLEMTGHPNKHLIKYDLVLPNHNESRLRCLLVQAPVKYTMPYRCTDGKGVFTVRDQCQLIENLKMMSGPQKTQILLEATCREEASEKLERLKELGFLSGDSKLVERNFGLPKDKDETNGLITNKAMYSAIDTIQSIAEYIPNIDSLSAVKQTCDEFYNEQFLKEETPQEVKDFIKGMKGGVGEELPPPGGE
jgi:hypothetical protein